VAFAPGRAVLGLAALRQRSLSRLSDGRDLLLQAFAASPAVSGAEDALPRGPMQLRGLMNRFASAVTLAMFSCYIIRGPSPGIGRGAKATQQFGA